MIDEPIGAALDRTLHSSQAPGEAVEHELDAFISKRHQKRLKEEGEGGDEEMGWKESARRYAADRDAMLREEWISYHQAAAGRHRATLGALIAHHEQEAEKYLPRGAA